MKKLVFACLLLALPHLGWGQLIHFSNTLTGLQEVPQRATPATGFLTATLDPVSLSFNLNYSFTGLLGPQTDAHIHRAPPGVSGPVIIPLPLGSPVTFSTTLTSAQANELLSNLWYVNIHSTVFLPGEIRGQITPVPEPSTYALAGVALLGVIVATRRLRKARAG